MTKRITAMSDLYARTSRRDMPASDWRPQDFISRVFRIFSGPLFGYYRVVYVNPAMNVIGLFKIKMRPLDGTGPLAPDMAETARGPEAFNLAHFAGLSEKEREEVHVALPPCTERSVESLKTLGLKKADSKQHNRNRGWLSGEDKNDSYNAQEKKYFHRKALMEEVTDPSVLGTALIEGQYHQMLEQAAKKFGVNRTTAARLAARYFVCDCDAHKAVMFTIFGDATVRKAPVIVKKNGRKNRLVETGHRPDLIGRNTTQEDVEKIALFLKSAKGRLPTSIAERHRNFVEAYVSVPAGSLDDGTQAFVPHPISEISYELFGYYVKKLESKRAQDVAKVGRSNFAKDKRILVGTARDLVQFPGQQYVIDSTIADVYLVNACNRKLLIARPTIYVVIDAFSSLILAVHVAMEDPCFEQARIAMFRALSPRDVIATSLGLPDLVVANLPQGCKPLMILADRGEFLSKGGLALAASSRTALGLTAPYRADWKSLVERYFGVQNQLVLHWQPGAVRKRALERGDRDTRHDAVLTINGLQRLLLALAAEWNATHDMSEHVSTTMLRTEVDATPIGFWNYGLQDLHGSPKFLTRPEAVREFLPSVEAKMNRLGLHVLEDLRFTAPWMANEDEFYRDASNGRARLIIDPDRPLTGYYSTVGTGELRDVELVDNRGYAEIDVAHEDIRDTEALVKLNGAEFAVDSSGLRGKLRAFRSGVTRDEAVLTKAASEKDHRSKTARVKNIKENRSAAIKAMVGLPSEPAVDTDDAADKALAVASKWAQGLDDIFGDDVAP